MATAVRRMRKIINEPDQVVKQSLAGLAAAHADLLRYDVENQILVRIDAPKKGKVALISGGGSGHEPLHGGFVGMGMDGYATWKIGRYADRELLPLARR